MLNVCALLANAAVIAFTAWLVAEKGFPDRGGELLAFAALLGVPVLNLMALLKGKTRQGKASLIDLYIERLRLEQESKIAALRKPNGDV